MNFPSNLIRTAALVFCLTLFITIDGFGQDADQQKAFDDANSRFVATLDQTDDLFYKAVKNDNGSTAYTVMWEQDGEISKIVLLLQELGHYAGDKVFGLLAFSIVAESEKSFPPAVIKLVTVESDKCALGMFTMPESFDKVYVAATMPSDSLTPGQVWITCAYIHKNRIELKKEIEQILAASDQR